MFLHRRLLIAFAIAAAASACVMPARADDPRLRALRGIEALHISVATYVGSSAGGPETQFTCPLNRAALEQRGAAVLGAAGLKPLTSEDTLTRNRVIRDEVQRDVRALREGPGGPVRDAEDRRHLDASIKFMRDLPALLVRIIAEPVFGPDGGMVCAVAVFANFVAPPRGRPTVATNGADVLAVLLLWSRRPLLTTVPAAEIGDAARRYLDEQVGAFVASWRAENAR